MADERFDGILLQMCQGHDSMEGILNTFFSFLRRKTDFYHVLQGDERVGFPPGVAEKLVLQAFTRYKDQHTAAPSRAAAGGSGAPPSGATRKVRRVGR